MKKLSAAMHREMLDGKTRYCFLGGSNARVVSIQRGKLSCFSKGTANMRQLQDTFDRYLSSLFKARAAQLAVKLIEQKAAKLGLTLSRKQKRGIFKKLEKGKASEINLHFRHIPKSKSNKIVITKNDRRIFEKRVHTLRKSIPRIIENITDATSAALLSSLKRRWPRQKTHEERFLGGFETRLRASWRKPLSLLAMLIKIALELGEAVNSQHRQMSKIKKPCTVEALTLLHARSCQVASEILVLLRSGFADGAIARWRTLHELVVVACFIRERGEIVAEPYFQHRAIEAYKAAKQYQQYCKLLHYEPLSELEIEHHKKLYDSAVEKFGAPFREQYGWAAAALKNPRPNFANIEQHVRLDHLRPFYKMASENVHAEPTGVIRRLGFIGQGAALAGPSNVGLADPGESTALSLMQITSCLLLLLTPTIDTVSMCKMMLKLTNEIGESFFSAQEKISEKAMRLGQT